MLICNYQDLKLPKPHCAYRLTECECAAPRDSCKLNLQKEVIKRRF